MANPLDASFSSCFLLKSVFKYCWSLWEVGRKWERMLHDWERFQKCCLDLFKCFSIPVVSQSFYYGMQTSTAPWGNSGLDQKQACLLSCVWPGRELSRWQKRIHLKWTGWKWASGSGKCPPMAPSLVLGSSCTLTFAHCCVSEKWRSISTASLGPVHLWSPDHLPIPTYCSFSSFAFSPLLCCLLHWSGCHHPLPQLVTRKKTWSWFSCAASQSSETHCKYLIIHALRWQLSDL